MKLLGRMSERHWLAVVAFMLVVIAVCMLLLALSFPLDGWRNIEGG